MTALALPPLLALVPHGAAPLAGFAGLCAAGIVAGDPPRRLKALRLPAMLLAALLAWGALSAAWSIHPWRSLVLDLRLLGLFAAVIALAAAAAKIARPSRLMLCLLAGLALGGGFALCDLLTRGGLSQFVSVRGFIEARLNQAEACLALLLLPVVAALFARQRRLLAALVAVAIASAICALEGTATKAALTLAVPAAASLYLRRVMVARLFAALSVIAVLTAPLTLPRLVVLPGLFAAADSFKDSAGHRLLIWSFVGARIAEHPILGWGLDSSRNIPGGDVEIRPAQKWLPLHPHDAPLQVWLELGAPGAVLSAALIALLWLRLAAADWPPLYAAAAGGSLAAALTIATGGWGVWQEWWIGTQSLILFFILVMARAANQNRIPDESRDPLIKRRAG